MDPILDVKEALAARSVSTSLDELRSKGKQRVKIIRAEHVAEMIHEAVQRAVEGSGLLSQEEVAKLVESSRAEFKDVLAERQQAAADVETARGQIAEAREALVRARHDRENLQSEFDRIEAENLTLTRKLEQFEQTIGNAFAGGGAAQPSAPAAGIDSNQLLQLMGQMLSLKAGGDSAPQPTSAPAPAAPGSQDMGALTNALEKLTSSVEDRLEKFGKKIGVSAAVDTAPAALDGLFKHMDENKLESNMEDVEVKSKTGGGIAGNLARLKKLKGGG